MRLLPLYKLYPGGVVGGGLEMGVLSGIIGRHRRSASFAESNSNHMTSSEYRRRQEESEGPFPPSLSVGTQTRPEHLPGAKGTAQSRG